MQTRTVALIFPSLFVCIVSLSLTVQAQQNLPDTPSTSSSQAKSGDAVVEGVVVSATRHTIVVRSDDNQYHLFTFNNDAVRNDAARPGARVRVSGSAPDEEGTQVADNVSVLQPASDAANSGQVSAAPPPAQVGKVTNSIENEARRWHVGGRIGVGFSPEIFLFGVQSELYYQFQQFLVQNWL